MNKPDWENAPPWANYLAMGDTSRWYWYEVEPQKHIDFGIWGNQSPHQMELAGDSGCFWESTLEKKPND